MSVCSVLRSSVTMPALLVILSACGHHSAIHSDAQLTAVAGETTARSTSSALADLNRRHDAYEKHLIVIAALEGENNESAQSRTLIEDALGSVTSSFNARRMFLRDLETTYRAFGALNGGTTEESFTAAATRLAGSLNAYGISLGKTEAISGAVNRLSNVVGKAYAGKKIQQANDALSATVEQAARLMRTESKLYGALQQEFVHASADATLALWRAGMLSSSALTEDLALLPGFIPIEGSAWTSKACKGTRNCAARRVTHMLANRETDQRLTHEKEALEAITTAFQALKNAHRDINNGEPVESYRLAAAVHALKTYTQDDYADLPLEGGPSHGGDDGLIKRLKARFR